MVYQVTARTTQALAVFPVPCSLTLLVNLVNLVTLEEKALNFLVATFNRKSSKSFESCLACWTALVYFRVYSRAYFSCECVSSSAQHLLTAHTVGRTLHWCKITRFVSLFNAVAPVGPELQSSCLSFPSWDYRYEPPTWIIFCVISINQCAISTNSLQKFFLAVRS